MSRKSIVKSISLTAEEWGEIDTLCDYYAASRSDVLRVMTRIYNGFATPITKDLATKYIKRLQAAEKKERAQQLQDRMTKRAKLKARVLTKNK